jgi:PPOX class probable F420-dependent enzyme
MPSGSCRRLADLPAAAAAILLDARRAFFATTDEAGRPHAVPICFAVRGEDLVTAVDAKPKRSRALKRVANVRHDPRAALLVDRWDEDWTNVGWVMVQGRARVDAPHSADEELRARYPQYRDAPPPGEVIVVAPHRILWWTAS